MKTAKLLDDVSMDTSHFTLSEDEILDQCFSDLSIPVKLQKQGRQNKTMNSNGKFINFIPMIL